MVCHPRDGCLITTLSSVSRFFVVSGVRMEQYRTIPFLQFTGVPPQFCTGLFLVTSLLSLMRQLLQIVLANATPWWAFTPAIQGTTGPAEQVAEVAVVTAGAAAAAEPDPSSSSAADLRECLRPIPSPRALRPGPMPICACVPCTAQLQTHIAIFWPITIAE